MILAPQVPYPQVHYRPTYIEIASADIAKQYRDTEEKLVDSREGSNFLRRKVAAIYAHQKLNELRILTDDWDSFGSEKPATDAIKAAGQVVDALVTIDLIPDAILPSAEGGVAICFVRAGRYADVECLNSGDVLAVTSTRGEKPHAWALDPNSINTATIKNLSIYLSA